MKKASEEIDLARAKFEYCANLYKQVSDNFEYLERKAQLFLSFITIFLGVIALNADFIKIVVDTLKNNRLGAVGDYALYVSMGVFIVFAFLALIALASSIRGQYWMVEYPENLAFSLYAPNSDFLKKHNEISFLNAIGFSYTVAIEHNREINDRKYARIEVATWCIYASIFSLLTLLILIFLSSIL